MSDRRRLKSQPVQLVLTLLLGPLGLFYSSVPAAVLVAFAAAVLAYDTDRRNVWIAWPLAVAIGFFTVRRWNHRASERAALTPTTNPGEPPCSAQET
jgi:hypothetical protein